jgi:hypothetical protein
MIADPPPAVGLGEQVGGEGADPDVAPDLAQAAQASSLASRSRLAESQSEKAGPWKMVARVDLLDLGQLHDRARCGREAAPGAVEVGGRGRVALGPAGTGGGSGGGRLRPAGGRGDV